MKAFGLCLVALAFVACGGSEKPAAEPNKAAPNAGAGDVAKNGDPDVEVVKEARLCKPPKKTCDNCDGDFMCVGVKQSLSNVSPR